MSLLHKVLRDLDQREQVQPVGVPVGLQMPAETVSVIRQNHTRRWALPVVLVVAAAVVWLAFNIVQQPVSAPAATGLNLSAPSQATRDVPVMTPTVEYSHSTLLSGAEMAVAAGVKATGPAVEPDAKPPVVLASEKPDAPVLNNASSIKNASSLNKAPALNPAATELLTTAPELPPQSAPAIKAPAAPVPDKRATKPTANLAVQKAENPAQDAYRKAVEQVREQQFQAALQSIDDALAHSTASPDAAESIPYLALKLRILLSMKDKPAFTAFYQSHRGQQDVRWLAVAAPGLHMLGLPDMAVAPYQQLIVQQPDVLSWPLALAAAWEDQGKPVPARALLANVLQHYRLQPEQQRWVERKIEVLGGKSGS
ncbi:hypothetical protein ACQUQU_02025 [Thalassolituus sp. LLYu03]|uniref:hypothetical protein n=1 Tax=Thalassolituus sp. LLYu03 TaxID=3421656 RepID=UPI003D2DDBB5